MTKIKQQIQIEDRVEGERGCGYRKQGGFYLMGGAFSFACGKLPIPLTYCPCCGNGIKFSRGFQWMSGEIFSSIEYCAIDNGSLDGDGCMDCEPFRSATKETQLGLMWIGEKFYPTPSDYLKEGLEMGLSKRIHQIPKKLKLGETCIMLAHKKAVKVEHELQPGEQATVETQYDYKPGIFSMFIPQHVEYVVREKKDGTIRDGQKKLKKLQERGVKLVRVRKREDVARQEAEQEAVSNALPLEHVSE